MMCVLGLEQAQAQTVVVIDAPPGTTIELVLETAVAASGTADSMGTAVLRVDPATLAAGSIDAAVRVDSCATSRRLLVTRRITAPPPAGLCTRTELAGVFLVQSISSMLFDFGGTTPTVRLWQGPPPAEWLRDRGGLPGTRLPPIAPRGLVLYAGGGLSEFRDFDDVHCGDLQTCTGDDAPSLWSAGVSYWFNPYIGAEGTFIKPGTITQSAVEPAFHFTSTAETGVVTAAAVGGYPVGRVRITGKFGAIYHGMTVTTTETINEVTVIVDEVPQKVAGGTQTTQTRTEGWGWLMAAGAEVWLVGPLGVYGELGQFRLNGEDTRGGEARIDEVVTYLVGGVKVRVPLPW